MTPDQQAIANAERGEMLAEFHKMMAWRDAAYTERDALVCALSKLWPSHLAVHDPTDTDWDPEWMYIVCVHAPVGQLTWHIHIRELPMFLHLEVRMGDWDGHTTEEKYASLARLEPRPSEATEF